MSGSVPSPMRHAQANTNMNVYRNALMESKRKANSKVVHMALRPGRLTGAKRVAQKTTKKPPCRRPFSQFNEGDP
jgi:hypothetical protein